MSAKCECWFLDVGQGASNVILLGNRRAIVIDCGPRGSSQTLHLLKTHVDFIEALIITHNDIDHDYNVGSIIAAYKRAIKQVLFLVDRPANKIRTWRTLSQLMSTPGEDCPESQRIEVNRADPQIIFSENDIGLTIVYPDFAGNLFAEESGTRRANRTSAIMRLSCGDRSVVFSGDATIEAWEHISANLLDKKSLACDVITVPHHGGRISNSGADEAQAQRDLYTRITRPEYGIVSVGTGSKDKHPFPETITALKNAGIKILCTQITKRCCEDLESLRSLDRVLFEPCHSTRKISTTQGGKSKHVACYSTIVAEISPQEIKFPGILMYTKAMDQFKSIKSFSGMCRTTN